MHASAALWAAGLLSLGLGWLCLKEPAAQPPATPLALAVVGFSAWLVITNVFANPSYTPAAPYHAAFLLGGFLLARNGGERALRAVFGAALAFGVALGAWALWQRAGGMARAQALFETPATLAATVNLVLIPCLVLVLAGRRSRWLLVCSAVLAAGLFAAQSSGGWLAAAAALLAAQALLRRLGRAPDAPAWAKLASVLAIGAVLASLAALAAPAGAHGTAGVAVDNAARQSSIERIALYSLAARALLEDFSFAGFGYLGFHYLFEAARHDTAIYGEGTTFFVHNDYLQILLELGVPGLAGLLAMVLLPLRAAAQAGRAMRPSSSAPVVAAFGATVSMGAHACFDFPFYIPICLLLFGLSLGMLEALLSGAGRLSALRWPQARLGPPARRAGVAAAALLAGWLLFTPLAGEAAAAYAQHRWQSLNAQSAAYWLEVARRIEPRDWRFHWYAGQFWFAQAVQNRDPTAARLAEAAFARGLAANPREARNLIGRMATQRHFGALLQPPAGVR